MIRVPFTEQTRSKQKKTKDFGTQSGKVSNFDTPKESLRRVCFVGSFGDDGEGVEAALELVGEEVVDETVSFDKALALELGGDDVEVEVGFFVGTTLHGGVARVLVRHVVHLQNGGFQRRLKLQANPAGSR